MGSELNDYKYLKDRLKRADSNTRWETAKIIYMQCKDKQYRKRFATQEDFARYIGVSKALVSEYKNAYAYYLFYKKEIDTNMYSVEQVYNFYRVVGKRFRGFSNWVFEQYDPYYLSCISRDLLKRLFNSYCLYNKNQKPKNENKKEPVSINITVNDKVNATIDVSNDDSNNTHKAITYKVPKDVQKQSIDTMKIGQEVKNYLHQHSIHTISDVIDNKNDIPDKYKGSIYAWLIFGIES